MITKLKNLEKNFSISKAAAIVAFFTLLSRVVGYLRDMLFASRLGPGPVLDTYYAAFRIPDFVFNLLILGTLSVAFIPVFTEVLIKDRHRAGNIANTVLNVSVLTMSAVCLVLIIFSNPLTRLIVPGFSGEKFQNTVLLTRIFLISPVIFTLSSVFSSILNANKKFLLVSLAPILYNLGIIGGLLVLYPRFGIVGWGFGVIAGALMHLLIQVPSAVRHGFSWRPVIDLKDEAVKKIGKLFIPRIFGLDVSNISLLIATIIGSTLAAGSISIFNLANNLQAVPLGVFAVSIATASFPAFSESFAKGKNKEFIETLSRAIVQILFFLIPISILMLLFRAYIVRLGFGHGHFDWNSTILTFTTLGIFSVSLFSQGLTPLLARAFYARQNTKTPVIINAFTMLVNVVLAVILGNKYGVAGLAAAFSAASVFNTLALFIILRLKLGKDMEKTDPLSLDQFDKNLFTSTTKIVLASVIMGFAGYGGIYAFAPLVNTHTAVGILIQSALAIVVGVAVFLWVSAILKLSEAKEVTRAFKRFFHFPQTPAANPAKSDV
jgi:putative peptidoglycan lipid II flippase